MDLKGTNHHKFSLKQFFGKDLPIWLKTKFSQHTFHMLTMKYKQNLRGNFFNLSYGTLEVQTITNFHLNHYLKMFTSFNRDQMWSAYPPHAGKNNIKKISWRIFFKFDILELKGPNYQIFIKTIFWTSLSISINTIFGQHTLYIELKKN